MSLLKTFTEEEKELLIDHGLSSSEHSQLSDSFVIGLRHAKKDHNKIKQDTINDLILSLAQRYVDNWIFDPFKKDEVKPSAQELIKLTFGVSSNQIENYLDDINQEYCPTCFGKGDTELISPDPIIKCNDCNGHGF